MTGVQTCALPISISRGLAYTMHGSPHILVTALVSTFTLFASFTGSALYTKNRSAMAIYLSSFLMTACSSLLVLSMFHLFSFSFGGNIGGSSLVTMAQMYLGLLVFSAFVMYDTQIMIMKAERGSNDYLAHSLDLYMDVVGLFMKIVHILQDKEDKKKKRMD